MFISCSIPIEFNCYIHQVQVVYPTTAVVQENRNACQFVTKLTSASKKYFKPSTAQEICFRCPPGGAQWVSLVTATPQDCPKCLWLLSGLFRAGKSHGIFVRTGLFIPPRPDELFRDTILVPSRCIPKYAVLTISLPGDRKRPRPVPSLSKQQERYPSRAEPHLLSYPVTSFLGDGEDSCLVPPSSLFFQFPLRSYGTSRTFSGRRLRPIL